MTIIWSQQCRPEESCAVRGSALDSAAHPAHPASPGAAQLGGKSWRSSGIAGSQDAGQLTTLDRDMLG